MAAAMSGQGEEPWERLPFAPLLPGKTDAWRQWIAETKGPGAAALADFNRRHG